jgi:cytochrome c oxidase assembly factor CtaG
MRDMGPGNMQPIRIDLHTLVRYWLISPFTCTVLAALVLAAFWYFQAAGDLAERGRPWPPQRTLAFCGGLLAIELAVQSSVAMLPYISFPMHVVQLLLLVVVATPLLVLGTPVALALETSGPRTRSRLLAATGSAPARVLSHPAVSFALLFFGLIAYFLTAALASSMRHVWLLNLINLGFLVAGLLFWWAVLGADAVPAVALSAGRRLGLLAGAIVLESVLGIALLVRGKPVAAIYTLTGTRQGGAIWWVVALLATLAALIAVFTEWNRGDEWLGPADSPELASSAPEQWPAAARLSPPG